MPSCVQFNYQAEHKMYAFKSPSIYVSDIFFLHLQQDEIRMLFF